MWKKWWDNLGNSWGGDGGNNYDQTANPGQYTSITTTGTGVTYNEILQAHQQMMQQQQLQKQYQYQYQTVSLGERARQYPFAIDEEFILIEWARKRGDEFAHELMYKREFAWSTALPGSPYSLGSLGGMINQQAPFLKYLKGKTP